MVLACYVVADLSQTVLYLAGTALAVYNLHCTYELPYVVSIDIAYHCTQWLSHEVRQWSLTAGLLACSSVCSGLVLRR